MTALASPTTTGNVNGHTVGRRAELARYSTPVGERLLYGQRIDGHVRFLPDDLVVLVLMRARSEDSSCRPRVYESRGARADAVRPKRPNATDNWSDTADEWVEGWS